MKNELFHSLEGEKIFFKVLELREAEEIHEYASDKEVKRFIGWRLMKEIGETKAYIEEMLRRESAGTHLYASIVLKSTGAVIGTAMIFNFDEEANNAEVGYVFHRQHWGKGYGTEALALMSSFAKQELKLHKLYANVVDENHGSSRILVKNGFNLEGKLKDHFYIEDRYYDKLIFGKML